MIQLDGSWFKDEDGRTLILRGVNLGGSSKIPRPPEVAEVASEHHREVSFVNRPFPLESADEHFKRLAAWGLTFIRLVVPWEAIEHAGPGQYDEAYLEYLGQIAGKAQQYGLHLFIDPHQDVWSRFSGGDGAPGWTLEAVGLDIRSLHATGAAFIHALADRPKSLQWFTNYARLATATMFTLFFSGNDFAPQIKIDDEPVQTYLQRHYIQAFQKVALKLKRWPNVVGFGTMNEPSGGFIGLADLNHWGKSVSPLGPSPTPFQAMTLGAGYTQEVDLWKFDWRGHRRSGQVRLNGEGQCAWQENRACIWREHGVWDVDERGQPRLLRPDYFSRIERGDQTILVRFGRDYLKPFINKFAQAIRAVSPQAILFVETTPSAQIPHWNAADARRVVNASHWYDVFTLFTALFIPFLNVDARTRRFVFGHKRIRQMFTAHLAALKQSSLERLGGVPTLVGEFGVSYNMPGRLNYRFNWFGMQEWALDAAFQALEANLLSGTLWNYTADNTNQLGDRWNGEDLSIFSLDQQTNPVDINSGGRALQAVVRPYPVCTAGEPLRLSFNYDRRTFMFQYRHDPAIQKPTEIFVPALHYPQGYTVEVSDGRYETDPNRQLLRYWHTSTQEVHTLELRSK